MAHSAMVSRVRRVKSSVEQNLALVAFAGPFHDHLRSDIVHLCGRTSAVPSHTEGRIRLVSTHHRTCPRWPWGPNAGIRMRWACCQSVNFSDGEAKRPLGRGPEPSRRACGGSLKKRVSSQSSSNSSKPPTNTRVLPPERQFVNRPIYVHELLQATNGNLVLDVEEVANHRLRLRAWDLDGHREGGLGYGRSRRS